MLQQCCKPYDGGYMNTSFFIALIAYLLVFMTVGVLDRKKVRSFTDYAAAGKTQNTFTVVMTLLATILGASTTIGITDTVYRIGFPGFWWLSFGAVGLVLQACFLSVRVRRMNADTLPDLAEKTVGRSAELLIAVIIVVSWIGVVAGQLVAMNSLISFALGRQSALLFAMVSLVVIGYTAAGGQLSVIKTDRLQLCIIIASVIACALYLYFGRGGNSGAVLQGIELVNGSYRPFNLVNQFFVIGGVYFLGPDILSRNFISRDGTTARRSAFFAGLAVLLFSLLITAIGMWLRCNVSPEEKGRTAALLYAASLLPKGLAVLLLFGLLSAVLSSTDTCIINAASIFAKDILKTERVGVVRAAVLCIGVLAYTLAQLGRGDILTLLTGAYSIYTPGVIFPLTVAILAHERQGVRTRLWLCAVAAGGLFGLAASYCPGLLAAAGLSPALVQQFPLIGMGLSLILALCSVRQGSVNRQKSVNRQAADGRQENGHSPEVR